MVPPETVGLPPQSGDLIHSHVQFKAHSNSSESPEFPAEIFRLCPMDHNYFDRAKGHGVHGQG